MRKYLNWAKNISLLLALCLLLCACKEIPTLPVYGDIPAGTTIKSLDELKALVDKYNITRMLLASSDETSIELLNESIQHIRLINDEGTWHLITDVLPPIANIKNIEYIAVDSDYKKYQVGIFNGTERERLLTPYEYIKSDFMDTGISTKNDFSIRKYLKFPSPTNLPVRADSVLAIFTDGTEKVYQRMELLKVLNWTMTHWLVDTDTLAIVWENYPQNSIYDLYPLLNDAHTPTLFIYVDGLGYNMIQNAIAHEATSFFTDQNIQPMRTTYPPKTKEAYFTVGNGFHLSKNNTNIPEIFSTLNIEKGFIIEEDKIPFSSKLKILLNTDQNNDGMIDDEIFTATMAQLDQPYDFILVHFHSIDDIAHKYGPYSPETMRQIEIVGEYVQQIIEKATAPTALSGGERGAMTIIFSDHGLHSQGTEGNHGLKKIDDMTAILVNPNVNF